MSGCQHCGTCCCSAARTRCTRNAPACCNAAAQEQQIHNIFDVASHIDSLPGSNAAAFKRIFRVTSAQAQCNVGPELAAKYKVQQDNEQHVVSVTNMHSLEQTWYNQARTTKPQTFNSTSAAGIDPTNNGANCDFCACKEQSLLDDL